jgi:hypothetical protein
MDCLMLYWNCQSAATNSRIDDRRVANNTTLHQPEQMEYLPWPKTDRRWYWPASKLQDERRMHVGGMDLEPFFLQLDQRSLRPDAHFDPLVKAPRRATGCSVLFHLVSSLPSLLSPVHHHFSWLTPILAYTIRAAFAHHHSVCAGP